MSKELLTKIESLETPMVEALGEMISYPAISPLDGGEGEFHKAQYLLKKIKELGFEDVKVYASTDPEAAGGERPNIVIRFPGKTKRRLWIVAHTDVVPEGERSLWDGPLHGCSQGRAYLWTRRKRQRPGGRRLALCPLRGQGA